MPAEPRRLLIVGYGRSGSTILERILGAAPGVVSVGELVNLPLEGWVRDHYCGCGERASGCAFWREVRRVWSGLSPVNVRSYVALQATECRPAILLRRGHWGERGPDTARYRAFLAGTSALYAAIVSVSGARLVVDSSKLPQWGLALSHLGAARWRALHLVRDGRAVVFSLAKSYQRSLVQGIQNDIESRSALRTSTAWLAVNLAAEAVARRAGGSMRLRYEEFATSPARTLAAIGNLVDIDLESVARAAESSVEFAPGHSIAGNRLRMESRVRLALDETWRGSLGPLDQAVFWGVAGLAARRYGYRRRG